MINTKEVQPVSSGQHTTLPSLCGPSGQRQISGKSGIAKSSFKVKQFSKCIYSVVGILAPDEGWQSYYVHFCVLKNPAMS
jgi:hypothetical protein